VVSVLEVVQDDGEEILGAELHFIESFGLPPILYPFDQVPF
jgi:hypothetical protein